MATPSLAERQKRKKMLAGCVFLVGLAALPFIVRRACKEPPVKPAPPPNLGKLPPHKLSQTGPKHIKARVFLPRGVLTRAGLERYGLRIANAYRARAVVFQIMVFDDEKCLEDWDGATLLTGKEFAHWLCQMSIEEDDDGNLAVTSMKLGTDPVTNAPKNDILGPYSVLPGDEDERK